MRQWRGGWGKPSGARWVQAEPPQRTGGASARRSRQGLQAAACNAPSRAQRQARAVQRKMAGRAPRQPASRRSSPSGLPPACCKGLPTLGHERLRGATLCNIRASQSPAGLPIRRRRGYRSEPTAEKIEANAPGLARAGSPSPRRLRPRPRGLPMAFEPRRGGPTRLAATDAPAARSGGLHLSRKLASRRRAPCVASGSWLCTAGGSSGPGTRISPHRKPLAQLHGSRKGSVSSSPGRC